MPDFFGLPPGLVLNRSTGEITGLLPDDTPLGTYGFTIEVLDADGNICCSPYEIIVRAPS